MATAFQVVCDPESGRVRSVTLYGEELLDPTTPCSAELSVNGLPLATRLYQPAGAREPLVREKDGEFRSVPAGCYRMETA